MKLLSILFLSLSFILVGCQTVSSLATNYRVLVLDEDSKPMSGASVLPVSMSVNWAPVHTNWAGQAFISEKIQSVEWVNVEVPGYKSVTKPINRSGVTRIVLERE